MVRPLKRSDMPPAQPPAAASTDVPGDLSDLLRLAQDELAGGGVSSDNPVRRMQAELERAMAGAPEPRWSARRTLAFMVITSALLWTGIIWGLGHL